MPDWYAHTRILRGAVEIELLERSPGRVVARLVVDEAARNTAGTIAAPAMLWLADAAGAFLASAGTDVAEDGTGFPVTVTLNAHLLTNQRDGEVRAVAVPVRRGRRLTVVRTQVLGTDDRLLCEVTTTHMPV